MKNKLSNSQTTVLIEVLRILRDEKNIRARKKIYESYIDHKLNNLEKINKVTRTLIEKLNGDFDEIGFLIKEFDIKDEFFGLYSDTIRRLWIALKNYIQIEKNERKKKDPAGLQYGYYFSWLAAEAKKYRDKNNLQEPGFTDLRSSDKSINV